jgi:ethanolamine ammonia-lyase large subunit
MALAHTIGNIRYTFDSLRELLAKATPLRSGDVLAGVAAESAEERVAAQFALADLPLAHFLSEHVVPYEADEVTRLIVDSHDAQAFASIQGFTVGELRDWLLSDEATSERLAALAPGLTPEMAAAVSKLMRVQDLILAAGKIRVVTRFRTTVGLPGRLSARLQPNHPTDDPIGIAASILDGLLLGSGDAVIGINPGGDDVAVTSRLLRLIDDLHQRFQIPVQSCVLAHVTTQMEALAAGAPVDLIFQSITSTEAANRSFGVNLSLLSEAHDAGKSLRRGEVCDDGTVGDNLMYFETGQGSALSANAHHGVDQQTLEARAYAVAPFSTHAGEHGGRLYRARVPVRRQTDHARRSRRSLLRQAAWAAHGMRRLLYQSCGGRPGRHGCSAYATWRCWRELHHGRSRCRRCDAQLSKH